MWAGVVEKPPSDDTLAVKGSVVGSLVDALRPHPSLGCADSTCQAANCVPSSRNIGIAVIRT